MNPLAILQLIEGAMALAPQLASDVTWVKNFLEGLFTAKLITAEQQNLIFVACQGIQARVLLGAKMPAWEVDPDPAVTAKATPLTPAVTSGGLVGSLSVLQPT